MPRTPTTPTLLLCDDLAEYLEQLATPQAPATVRRAYLRTVKLLGTKGRQVRLMPGSYDNAPATRGEDFYTHRIRAVMWHAYPLPTDENGPPDEWVDEEADWVHTYVVQGLEFGRSDAPPLTFTRGDGTTATHQLMTLSADVTEVASPEELDQNKAFACVVEMVFRELI